MSEKNVPVEKGNYTLEPPEREALFDQYRGEVWPEGYKEYRKNWNEYPKKLYVAEYPLNVDLELSTVCNLKCPMCFTILEDFKKQVPTQFMDYELFKKIINEIGGQVPAIRLSFRGESTLCRYFVDAIRYAKEKGIKEVSTLTNGSTVTEEFFTEIMFAGMDWITVSVDGMDEIYEQIRKPIKFQQILENIKLMKRIKEKHNRHRPVIKIQTIWSAIKNDPEKFYNTFAPYADLVAFNPDVDFSAANQCINKIKEGVEVPINYIEDFVCPSLFQRLFVCSDGKSIVCCFDMNSEMIIGDANQNSIYDIWHGEKMNKFRQTLSQKDGFKKFPICRACIYPRAIDETETAQVNGRRFHVYNYL